VDRIRSTVRTREKFTYPEDFTPESFIDGSFGLMGGDPTDVVIDFEPDQARYVMERRWHTTQGFETLPDGRVRMTMSVTGLADGYRWLVGHLGTFEDAHVQGLEARVVQETYRGGLRDTAHLPHGCWSRSREDPGAVETVYRHVDTYDRGTYRSTGSEGRGIATATRCATL
jgi:hypothetical protein